VYRDISRTVHPLPEHLQDVLTPKGRKVEDLTEEEREEYEAHKKKYWFTGHDLRRTFATISRTVKNIDLELVQDAMGHEQITTTQIYLREKEKTSRKRFREQMQNNGNSD